MDILMIFIQSKIWVSNQATHDKGIYPMKCCLVFLDPLLYLYQNQHPVPSFATASEGEAQCRVPSTEYRVPSTLNY